MNISPSSNPKIYIGVYGMFIQNNSILMIKKARGPYTGLYDLPGGGINFKEKIDDCLVRELKEETNADVLQMDFFDKNEFICEYQHNEHLKTSHHIGLYYAIKLKIDYLKTDTDGEDSLGALFIPFASISEQSVSPIAFPVIKKFISKQLNP